MSTIETRQISILPERGTETGHCLVALVIVLYICFVSAAESGFLWHWTFVPSKQLKSGQMLAA